MSSVPDDQFVHYLTACQLRLFAYIVALMPNSDAANDVLQETNAELWSQRSEFRPESKFSAWACKIAYYKVLSYCRDQKRDRHMFDVELLDDLAARSESQSAELDQRARWLDECLSELPDIRRVAILERYSSGNSVNVLANAQSKTPGAVSKALGRTRLILLQCIRRKMAESSS